eukprot:GEMP01001876.1.p1 GENE.GEMP01001876.1~~GEMP01001876.1.p1  ORF type:complete len:1242 (+),score=183.28 GEMP01001876.1:73-3798(+)
MRNNRSFVPIDEVAVQGWDNFIARNLVWPTVFIMCCIPVFVLLNKLMNYLFRRFPAGTKAYTSLVMHRHQKVARPIFLSIFLTTDFFLSLTQVVIWIVHSYTRDLTRIDVGIELAINIFFAIQWFLFILLNEFHPSALFSVHSLLDVFVFVPVLIPCTLPPRSSHEYFLRWIWRWSETSCSSNRDILFISLSYIRVISLLLIWKRIQFLRDPNRSSLVVLNSLALVVRSISVLVFFSCTIYVLEMLGEHSSFQDTSVETDFGYGGVSFFTMLYFIMCTISTVGYGDYSPTTTLSQLVTMIFIVVGVIYFSNEVVHVMEVRAIKLKGLGWYNQRSPHHVVICGSGVAQSTTMLHAMLSQLLHTSYKGRRPDVVILTESPLEQLDDTRYFVQLMPISSHKKVVFLHGSAFREHDLFRARVDSCATCYVIADPSCTGYTQQDAENIYRYMAIRNFCHELGVPLKVRAMFLKPESKARALNIGINPVRCFSAMVLKATMIALSARAKGAIPLLCAISMNPPTSAETAKKLFGVSRQYHGSLRNRLHVCALDKSCEGKSWATLCLDCYAHNVIPIALERRGEVVLCPTDSIIAFNDILFAITEDVKAMKSFANPEADWQQIYADNRSIAQRKIHEADDLSATTRELRAWEIGNISGSLGSHHYKYESDMQAPADTGLVRWSKQVIRRARSEMTSIGLHRSGGLRPTEYLQGLREEETMADMGEDPGDNVDARGLYNSCVTRSERRCTSIIVFGAPSWPQVATLLRTLRSSYLPAKMLSRGVIVLTETAPPTTMVELFQSQRISFITGSPDRTQNLTLAGVGAASAVLAIMGPIKDDNSSGSTDHRAVVGSVILQRYMDNHGCRPDTLVYEFTDGEKSSMLFSESTDAQWDNSTGIPDSLEMLRQSVGSVSNASLNSEDEMVPERPPDMTIKKTLRFFRTLVDGFMGIQPVSQWYSRKRMLLYNARFAAGEVFSTEIFGYILASSYYLPVLNEVIAALILPFLRQEARIWQISPPEAFIGRTFGDYYRELTQDHRYACVPIALYRRTFTDCGPITEGNLINPSPETELEPSDLLTVLANKRFAEDMLALGLLNGYTGRKQVRESDEEKEILRLVAKHKVIVFSKEWCPYCAKAVDELANVMGENNPHLEVIALEDRDHKPMRGDIENYHDAFEKICASRTIPKVFLGGAWKGGSEEMVRLARNGKLRPMLAELGVLEDSKEKGDFSEGSATAQKVESTLTPFPKKTE